MATIRFMKPEDERPLRKLMMKYLKSTYDEGGDIPPTLENAATSIHHGIEGAALGDPCLVAEENGKIVGYTICRGIITPGLTTRYKSIRSWGTYVIPEYRCKNIATMLLITAGRVAKIAGYDEFIGLAHGTNYEENSKHIARKIRGMKEVGRILVMKLTRPAKDAEESEPRKDELH
jgi:GNAT superfamily N-acetyltransferase